MSNVDLSGGLPASREYFLAECPAPEIRDAANIWLEEENGAFGVRVFTEALSPHWDSHDVALDIAFADGRVISHRGMGAASTSLDPNGQAAVRSAGPITFECVESFRRWTVSYKGQAADITAMDLIRNPVVEEKTLRDVDLKIDLHMAAPPWVAGTLRPEAAESLKGEQGDFMSPRYEQLFRATGTLRLADKTTTFKANGLRIRRQGIRKFEGFWGHCWQSALFPSGKAFGYNAYPERSDGAPSFNEGFIFDGEGALVPARAVQIPWMTELLAGGEHVPLVLETSAGRISIDGTSFANTRSRANGATPAQAQSQTELPKDWPIVQQAHARYRWGDEEACGMMERSTLKSKMKL